MITPVKMLFLGDSLVEWGDWEELLPEIDVVNRGVAGEHVEELSGRLLEEINITPDPDHILIMAGTNNLLMGNSFFTAIYRSMLPRLSSLCPDSSITLNSLMPMDLPGLPKHNVVEINKELQEVAKESNCLFLDMLQPFQEQCLPISKPGFLNDGVHLSTHGYQVWAGAIRDHLIHSEDC